MKIIVIGGGWAGCSAALVARNQGAEVILIERTDMLLGTGLVGGIMRNNGRYTAAEELIAMGGGDLFELADRNTLHREIEFPGHHHANLYSVARMEPMVRGFLLSKGISIQCQVRVTDVEMADGAIRAVQAKQGEEPLRFEGDVFIDATGTAGGPANCNKYGNGCAMCVLRCHSFGGRVSVTAKAGVKEMIGRKGDQIGAMSGSCKLLKESLDPQIVATLDKKGVAVIPLPPSKMLKGKLDLKCCQQYAIPEFEENIVLLDTGHAKLMTPFFPLDALRAIPGFENARYEDPYAGGIGNSIRYVGMAPRDDALKVDGRCQSVLRRREGWPFGGPHRGYMHRRARRLQRREGSPQRKAAGAPGFSCGRGRHPFRAPADAGRRHSQPEIHLFRVSLFRKNESQRALYDRPGRHRAADRSGRPLRHLCWSMNRVEGKNVNAHLSRRVQGSGFRKQVDFGV